MSFFIDTNKDEDVDYDEFVNSTKSDLLNNLNIDFYKMKLDGTWIDNRSEIIKLKDDILKHIKEMADE
ncbi:MAG: hypothetical protein IE909_09425 [Campylobacterales bacterium]|nr:hypothetical protein [Campylobacterales bacterium]